MMSENSIVRARINERIKDEAAAVLGAMGLTVSDAFRMMMVRIATERALPFEPLIPNAKTVAAMKAARRGELATAGKPGKLLARLMRTIKYTGRFKRDYKREKSGQHGKTLDAVLMAVVDLLAADATLPRRNFDHPLSGVWSDFHDCHLKPDLILIYRKPDAATLELVRVGSHSELGL